MEIANIETLGIIESVFTLSIDSSVFYSNFTKNFLHNMYVCSASGELIF